VRLRRESLQPEHETGDQQHIGGKELHGGSKSKKNKSRQEEVPVWKNTSSSAEFMQVILVREGKESERRPLGFGGIGIFHSQNVNSCQSCVNVSKRTLLRQPTRNSS
jgi:hypothetical protein